MTGHEAPRASRPASAGEGGAASGPVTAPEPEGTGGSGAASARQAPAIRGDPFAERYAADGFYFPIRVIGEPEAEAHLARVVAMEKAGNERGRFLRGKAHLACRFIDELARSPAILDRVERVLGPDILLWGSGCFIKAPRSPSYVSWHQDLNYWGLDGTEEVNAWLALSASNEENGCMRFVPGSHRRGPIGHCDSFARDNLLSRGQELSVEIDEGEAVPVCLAPGEMSLHHGRMFHASGPNASRHWRVGLALRYITPSTRQVVGERDFAQLVRGEDRFGHFESLPRPRSDDDPAAMRRFDVVDEATRSIFYAGAARPGRENSPGPARAAASAGPDTSSGGA